MADCFCSERPPSYRLKQSASNCPRCPSFSLSSTLDRPTRPTLMIQLWNMQQILFTYRGDYGNKRNWMATLIDYILLPIDLWTSVPANAWNYDMISWYLLVYGINQGGNTIALVSMATTLCKTCRDDKKMEYNNVLESSTFVTKSMNSFVGLIDNDVNCESLTYKQTVQG